MPFGDAPRIYLFRTACRWNLTRDRNAFFIYLSAHPDIQRQMEQLAQNFKGLAEPIRLRAIRLLGHGELCICDLMNGLDLPQSTVSRHMSFLKNSGWVTSQRKGQWVYYSLTTPARGTQALVLQALKQNLPAMQKAKQDYARLMNFLETKEDGACARPPSAARSKA